MAHRSVAAKPELEQQDAHMPGKISQYPAVRRRNWNRFAQAVQRMLRRT